MPLTPAQPDRAGFNKLKGDARELAIHRNDCKTFAEFWHRHAMPSLVAPSCLVCGKSMQGEQPAITHAELPNIVVCFQCRDKTQVVAAERERCITRLLELVPMTDPDLTTEYLREELATEQTPISRAEMDRRFVRACEDVDPFNRNR